MAEYKNMDIKPSSENFILKNVTFDLKWNMLAICFNYTRQRSGWGTSEVAGSRSDEVTEFLSMYLILSASLVPRVHSASNRNEYQKQQNNVSGE
jgi:hypothetical protein